MKTYFMQKLLDGQPIGKIGAILAQSRAEALYFYGNINGELMVEGRNAHIVYEVDTDNIFVGLGAYREYRRELAK